MNIFMQQHGEMYHETQVMRDQLMDILTDADLAFSPGGSNPTLGELCREMADVEASYIGSIKLLKQDWSYRNPQQGLAQSVSQLQALYSKLDSDLKATMEGLTDEDLSKTIDRGWPVGVGTQLHIYREGLLIYYGKVAVYLKAMGKPMPKQWQDWIG
ncbi:MAG: hypothetical protein GC179_29955 [Anaerolineaceae bacterium]|nr:hypothetical protein [Anaerolineaceae bacterium]